MKRIIIGLFVVTLLLLCGCSRREQNVPTPEQNSENDFIENTEIKPTQPPASGTDLPLPEPLTEESAASLEDLRRLIMENDAVCGIAFVAYADPQQSLPENIVSRDLLTASGIDLKFPFVAEITADHCVNEVYSDIYCFVPAEVNSKVLIELLVHDAENGEWTSKVERELFYTDDGAPILLSSQSNGWGGSNIRITVTTPEGKTVSFRPALLSNYGTVNPCAEVYDFSLYDET